MWEDNHYCWAVLCKNQWFHARDNLFFRHRILLAETDPYMPFPVLPDRFAVRCDKRGKGYSYKRGQVLRVEQELPESFRPNLLFSEAFGTSAQPPASRDGSK